MEWITLRHEDTGGTTRIPDDPDVLVVHQSRGWSVAVEPDEDVRTVVVPGEEWVELVHPDLPTATHRVPNNAAAIAGALAGGWQYPAPAIEPAAPKRRKETPAVDAGTHDQPAGDGAQQEE